MVGTLKKPEGDLTDIFCVTASYHVHKIVEQIEKGEKYTYGGIPLRHGNCHEKSTYKTFLALWNEKGCHEVHISLPEQKVQKRYTGTTASNITGAI